MCMLGTFAFFFSLTCWTVIKCSVNVLDIAVHLQSTCIWCQSEWNFPRLSYRIQEYDGIAESDIQLRKPDTVHDNYLKGISRTDQIDLLDGLLLYSHFLCLPINQTSSASCFFPRIVILNQGSHWLVWQLKDIEQKQKPIQLSVTFVTQ